MPVSYHGVAFVVEEIASRGFVARLSNGWVSPPCPTIDAAIHIAYAHIDAEGESTPQRVSAVPTVKGGC